MAFNRGRPPRFTQRLLSDPRFARARSTVSGWAGEGTDRYVRLGFVVFFLVLLVALVTLLAGGSAHKPARNELTAGRAELTTPAPAATVAGGSIPGLKPAATDDNNRSDQAEGLAPGFPGGIHIDRLAAALTLAPGFPGGLKIGSALLASELLPAGAAAASATPVALAGVPPGAIPTPPALAGVPVPGGAVTTAVPGASSPNPAAAAFPSGSTGIPSSPPIAAAPPPAPISIAVPPAPISISAPQIGAAPSDLPAPPIIIPPVGDSTGGSGLPVPPLPDGKLPVAGMPSGLPAAPQAAMTLDVTVLSHQGAPATAPRVQAISGQIICADETAANIVAASIQLTLPGACADLSAGSPLAFRAAGFDVLSGLIVSPAPSCAVNGDTPATAGGASASVLFQPGTVGQHISLLLGVAPPSASCPHDELNTAGAMMLSVTVRAAGAADPLTSPVVRVAVAGKQCGEGASSGSTVAHLSLPPGCGKPGDLLTFEAAGQDGSGSATPELHAACSYEQRFAGGAQPTPLYQPIAFAQGLRSASVILAALSDCPDATALPAAPPVGTAMSLRLSLVDPMIPGSPFARPTVTAFVAGVACVRASSIDTQDVVLTVPQACGAAGTPVSFRVSSPDPRFVTTTSADVPACALDLPAASTTAGSFRPVVRQIALRPGISVSFGLLSSDAVCAATATASPTPAPAATATPTRAPSPSATATPAPASSPAPAAPLSTPSPVPATTAVSTALAEPISGAAAAGTATGTPSPTPTPVEVHGPDQVGTGVPGSNPR